MGRHLYIEPFSSNSSAKRADGMKPHSSMRSGGAMHANYRVELTTFDTVVLVPK
jgi:hypothetical protein